MKKIIKILKVIIDIFDKEQQVDNKDVEKKAREDDLSKRIDRASTYATELDKSVLWLITVVFGAIIFAYQHFHIVTTLTIILLFQCISISLICLLFSMFLSKWQKQKNIKMQELGIMAYSDNNSYDEKKFDELGRESEKIGNWIERFSFSSYILFLMSLFLFAHSFFINIDKFRS
ncbi:MAG: hypothetical protein FWG57_08070 [Endomicrobia bacterium]|nr:hypothetical protein [Bacillota bacterium]MCL1972924.1 hypothetical protein [Endomicrobiia bacterium]